MFAQQSAFQGLAVASRISLAFDGYMDLPCLITQPLRCIKQHRIAKDSPRLVDRCDRASISYRSSSTEQQLFVETPANLRSENRNLEDFFLNSVCSSSSSVIRLALPEHTFRRSQEAL